MRTRWKYVWGLRLMVFVNASDYLPTTDAVGVRIAIHGQKVTSLCSNSIRIKFWGTPLLCGYLSTRYFFIIISEYDYENSGEPIPRHVWLLRTNWNSFVVWNINGNIIIAHFRPLKWCCIVRSFSPKSQHGMRSVQRFYQRIWTFLYSQGTVGKSKSRK